MVLLKSGRCHRFRRSGGMLLEEGRARFDRCATVDSQGADCSKHTRWTVSGSVRVHLQTYRTRQLDAGTRD